MKAQVLLNVLIAKLFILLVNVNPIDAIGGICIIIYFLTMLYYNGVKKHHGGSWWNFITSIVFGAIRRIKSLWR